MKNVEMIMRGIMMLHGDKAKIEYLRQHLNICHSKLADMGKDLETAQAKIKLLEKDKDGLTVQLVEALVGKLNGELKSLTTLDSVMSQIANANGETAERKAATG